MEEMFSQCLETEISSHDPVMNKIILCCTLDLAQPTNTLNSWRMRDGIISGVDMKSS